MKKQKQHELAKSNEVKEMKDMTKISKVLNPEVENQYREIDGAVLTPELLKYISGLQHKDNELLNEMLSGLAEAAMFIAGVFYTFGTEDRKKASFIISDLAIFRENLMKIGKEVVIPRSLISD